MYLQELQDVIDSVNLVDQFHNSQAVRLLVNTRFQYKDKRSVLEFISRLNTFSPAFASQWKKTLTSLNASSGLGARKYWSDVFKDKVNTQIGSFLEYCYASQSELDATLNRAINYYTQTNHDLTAEQIAYLRNLQMQQGTSKINGLSSFLKQNGKKIEAAQTAYTKKYGTGTAATNKSANPATQQAALQNGLPIPLTPPTPSSQIPVPIASTQPFADLGSTSAPPPTEMGAVAIHASEPPKTASQANVPVQNIQQATSYVRQVFTSPSTQELASEAGSRLSVGLIRAQPVKRAENLISNFASQIGLGSGSRINYTKGIYGGRLSPNIVPLRTGAKIIKAAGLFGRSAAMANPWFIAGIAIVVFIFLFFFLIMNQNGAICGLPGQLCQVANAPTNLLGNSALTLKKSGTDQVSGIGQDITYALAITYTGTGYANATITDKIPDGTQLKLAEGSQNNNGVLTWTLNNLQPNQTQTLTFIVTTTQDHFWAENQANATYQEVLPNGGGGNIPPTHENCNGKWNLTSSYGNFGDPNCDFSVDALGTLLNSLDQTNAKYWMDTIIRCESGFDPNAYNPHSTSGLGAYGLFQMNPSPPKTPPDVGNVEWHQQARNAVDELYGPALGSFKNYWEAAIRGGCPR